MNESSKGRVQEIFSGIQGEGLLVGERQIFVRLAGCNLYCDYCDTPSPGRECLVEQTASHRSFLQVSNPMSPLEVVDCVSALEAFSGLHHSVSITGGEPLFQPSFAEALARGLKGRGFLVFLETNGSLPDELHNIVPYVDFVSMDIKLPSAVHLDLLSKHEAFLRKAVDCETYVKIVLTSLTTSDEITAAVEMLARVCLDIPLILQPVTPQSGVIPPSAPQVLEWQAQSKLQLSNVRVIPQCHKIMDQR